MKKNILIIGNGFDIDLGLPTRYTDFAKSEEWSQFEKECDEKTQTVIGKLKKDYADDQEILKQVKLFKPLFYRLQEAKNRENSWFDIEGILRSYSMDNCCMRSDSSNYDEKAENAKATVVESFRESEEKVFQSLCKSLHHYLKHITKKENQSLKKDSCAAQLLKVLCDNDNSKTYKTYNFNYTGLYGFAQTLYNSKFYGEHVHGSIQEKDSIILGIEDKCETPEGYEFLKKVFNYYYRSHHIRFELEEADTIIFFGLSFGDIDYPYFKEFFNKQSTCTNKEGKHIIIFTYDKESRMQILRNISRLNDHRLDELINSNTFKIYCTKSEYHEDDKELNKILADIIKSCEK